MGLRMAVDCSLQLVINALNTFPNCVVYEVDFVTFDEAKKRLCQDAFSKTEFQTLMEISHRHLGEKRLRNALPLTLEVMGS